MRNRFCEWVLLLSIGFGVFGKWVGGFEFDESEYHFNTTEVVSLLEESSAAAAPKPLLVGLTLIPGAAAKGAVCLDGTLPGYHLHRGFESGANSWLIQLEGGGWCNTIESCVLRKTTRRGSSNQFEKQLGFTGILSNKAEENPDFFNWNRVKVRYCDGASFAGDSEDKGVAKNLSPTCLNQLNPTSCFFPQNIVPNIQTPMFILNAAYDSWQVLNSLSPPSADPSGVWKACENNPGSCTPSQMNYFQDFRNQILDALKGFSKSTQNGLFLNSCFAHCQTERQDMWFADDSPVINNKAGLCTSGCIC